MRRSWYGTIVRLALVLGALAAGGCAMPVEDAPDESTIEFAPSAVTWEIPIGSCIDVYETFSVVVRNGDGEPLNDVEVLFTASLAPLALLFVNTDGTDAIAPSVTRTTNEDGRILLQVHLVGCGTFADDVEARSGTAFELAHIEVKEA